MAVAAAVDYTANTPPATATTMIPVAPQRPIIRHVLIISEDGLRADAVATLHLNGTTSCASAAATAITRSPSATPRRCRRTPRCSRASQPKVHGLTWNTWRPNGGYIKTPTIFTRAMDAGLTTAFFTGKTKLRHIVPPGAVGIYERPGYYCKKVAAEAAEYLATERPALAFVHFSDPDELGHAKGWMSSAQKNAINHSDQCLGVIYEALERSGLIDDTLLIVTADHGGHNRVHSGAKKIDREIPWIACGPGVREDYVMDDPPSTLDTAATALYALGLAIPSEIEGKPRTDIFQALPKVSVVPVVAPASN